MPARAPWSTYDLPLNEVVFDFYDRLKSVTKGYASFDYQLTDYREGDLVKMSDPGERRAGGRALHDGAPRPRRIPRPPDVREAEGPDPQHMFQIPIQAAIGARVIARETIPPCART
jgi:GTP-binding protein LepA